LGKGSSENADETETTALNDKTTTAAVTAPATATVGPPVGLRRTSTGDQEPRETWNKKVDFLLSVIGFAVDLANVWRFPYYCYKNGGGAFLIPYGIMLFVGGIPLFYMELALGQYYRKGAITSWGRIVPLLKGIGFAVVLIAFYVDFFYNVIIAWALHFFISSFTSRLPWTSCDHEYNTPSCVESINVMNISTAGQMLNAAIDGNLSQSSVDLTNYTSAADEYFHRGLLELNQSKGIGDLGTIKWDIALCLLAVYLICYFSLWKGISTSGKVVWFTALFPYAVLLILLIRGITLPGSANGIYYYLNPDFKKLLEARVWVDAATQVFFSLGPGFGVLMAFASYNKYHNNVYRDALLTSMINCVTSFLAGFVIFSVLGYMSLRSGKDIGKVAVQGPGLVFVVYPEAIATMPGSTFWSLLFFMMLMTLGLDSSFGGSEAIITALSDEYPVIGRHREIFVGCLFSVYFLVGLASVSQGGFYVFSLLERFAAEYSILIAVFFESIAVSWIYGIDRFCGDIKDMTGSSPGIYWRVCWKFVAPIFLLFITVYGLYANEPLKHEDYTYPTWALVLGWSIAGSSVAMIPAVAIYQIIITPGTFCQRMRILTTPYEPRHESVVMDNNPSGERPTTLLIIDADICKNNTAENSSTYV